MISAGVSLPVGLSAFKQMFNGEPAQVLRAIGYFGDGDLNTLGAADQKILRDARDRVGRCQAERQGHYRQRIRRQRQAQHDGQVQSSAGFGMPRVAVPSLAGGLLLGDDRRSRTAACRGQRGGFVHRGGDGFE